MSLVEEIQFSHAKAHLSAVMDDIVHRDRLTAIRRERGRDEVMYLLPRDLLDAALGAVAFSVDYLPDEAGIGLWLNDLEVGAHGSDVTEARARLLREVRAYVANFLGQLPVYLTWPDRARLVPQVLRLAVARDEGELARLLFGGEGA